MAFNISEIRSQLVYGGWRPTHFQVIISNPFAANSDNKTPFMVKAASLPEFTIGKIPVPYFGRTINVPGDRVWLDWTTTVINDEDFLVRDGLERWSNQMNAFERNVAQAGSNPNNYKSQAIIRAFGKDGTVLREYQLNGAFPTSVTGIDTDWAATDTIAEFQVVWSFDDCQVIGGITGDAGGA